MYSQFLYFIIALLLFTIQQPGSQPFFSPWETSGLAASFFGLYIFLCSHLFNRLRRFQLMDSSQFNLAARYYRLQSHLTLLALGMLIVNIYGLNIKFYLRLIPGFDQSLTFSGVGGLVLFLIHLTVIWFFSHPIYQHIHHSTITRAAFIKGHLSFNAAVLIPWLLTLLLSDLLEFIGLPGFLKSDPGQFALMGMVLLFFILFAPPLVVHLWGGRPLPEGPVRSELEEFCRHRNFTVGNLMLWPLFGGETLTAGIIGLLPSLRYILITSGLLAVLDVEELKAVVGHEMGHARRYHLLFYLFFFLSYAWLTYSLNDVILLFLLQYEPFLQWSLTSDTLHLTLFSLVYSIPILLMLVLYFRYIFGFFMRNSERQADLYALQLVGHPFTLISSLEKIALYSGHIKDLPSWHHYSIRQRIDFLLDAHTQPSLIRRHNRKLYGSAAFLLVIIVCLTLPGYRFRDTQMVKEWRLDLEARIMERILEQNPDNAKLYAQYGGLLFEGGRISQAESVLRKALEMSPDDPHALNNLAWLYATAAPPHYHPAAALELALQATSLDSNPQYLDTLAEAYYANGRYAEAIETIERALLEAPPNPEYYLKQKEKFEEALRNQKAGRKAVDLGTEKPERRERRCTFSEPRRFAA